ncbi:MAG: hypothetical protein WBA13_15340 [Microcoleaceae cyanobacterium]
MIIQQKIKQFKKYSLPLDRLSILLMGVLTVLISFLILSGDHTAPRVREFSWNKQQISAEDQAFSMMFSRPMNLESVEKNLRIDPPLAGKFSWAGRRMVYTLLQPAPYGTPFSIQLQGATDRLYTDKEGREIQPFTGYFRTRDRAFVYIGVQGEEEGRLMLVNLSQDPQPLPLTPLELTVNEFEPYPEGDRILFSAVTQSESTTGTFDPQLYTVTTGLSPKTWENKSKSSQLAGEVKLLLDNKKYRNLKFDLSPNGEAIVIQRVNKNDSLDASPWIIESNKPAKSLKLEGGDFLIGPDSESLIVAQGPDLTTILPLEPEAEPLEFLPKYGQVLAFSKVGSTAAMIKFNSDGTRSLFIVNNLGEEREIYRSPAFGNIISAEFDPSGNILYCLLTELLDNTEEYQEQPFIAAIDINSGEITPLVILPNQQEINLSLSPDGLALLFDQTVTQITESGNIELMPRTLAGDTITTSRLWILPLDLPEDNSPIELQPEELPFFGYNPYWLP